jgi:membrane protease YdiL (CAAX protease family)
MTDHPEVNLPGARSKTTQMLGRVVQFPLTRIILALALIAAVLIAVGSALGALGDAGPLWLRRLVGSAAAVVATHLAYVAYVRVIERREVKELSAEGAPAELGLGALIGAGVMTAAVTLLWLAGMYEVEAVRSPMVTGAVLAASIQAGYIEEVMFRGVIFRITEEGLGSWWALAISSALFGLAHIGNPNATWLSAAAIMIEAGILLGATYMLTQRLWAVMGMHFAWNYTQGGVFGISVSGTDVQGMLVSRLSGPEILTGGAFGIEASLLTVILCVVVAAFVLRRAIRRGHLVRPSWRREKVPAPA